MERIAVTILTGFLGSGKTTLLNRVLNHPSMAKAAVIINEFGEISLDHKLAAKSDDTVMVLENGCLCCTVFGDLITTLGNLYHSREDGTLPRFEHVMIETSGLADPSSLTQAFLSDPIIAALYDLRDVVTIVDAVNGADTFDRYVEAVHQVALADHILITKLDLLAPDRVSEAEAALNARLRALNPAASINRADAPSFDTAAFLEGLRLRAGGPKQNARKWLNADAYAASGAVAGHDGHGHDLHGISSFCFIRDRPIPREALDLLLNALQQNLGPSLLRIKGIVHVAEEPDRPAVVQGAQHLLHNLSWLERWPDRDRRSFFVFITQGYERAELEEMIALLDRVAERTAAARAAASRI